MSAFWRSGLRSINHRENGSHVGQTTSASPRNATTASRWTVAWALPSIVNQTTPSAACCAANTSGMDANITCRRVGLRVSDFAPAPSRTPGERQARGC